MDTSAECPNKIRCGQRYVPTLRRNSEPPWIKSQGHNKMQVIIDSCKRLYEIDGVKEIDRISKLSCMSMKKEVIDKNGNKRMKKCDFPEFMKYTREIAVTKDGKELPQEDIEESKSKLKGRINKDLVCPMNWLQEWLDKIQGASTKVTTPTENFFIKMKGRAHDGQLSKIMYTIINYDNYIKEIKSVYGICDEYYNLLLTKTSEVTNTISKIKIGNIVTINRLIEISLGLSDERGNSMNRKYNPQKYTKKILNILYHYNKDKFLCNFQSSL